MPRHLLTARAALPVWLKMLVRFAVGVGIGVLLHYMLYRISLPMQPFIYVAF